ncbi:MULTISPECIES: hypothetical protein [unclassified Coleofasciculus]|uniref:hypothetical protein n=1 Tax=unclassified Coleofasciculus TaxID=2692782 RepID=UPI001880500C|nr:MULTISPECIES: hypothetical protein [unclassified Coleofasciculus]MBE9129572.1 hypothetical protein [Coleofasciculus sp. LEGE 07081]MBE9152137.1 hypothetical protein [Coleofasciculus sp. LEGE 07092]
MKQSLLEKEEVANRTTDIQNSLWIDEGANVDRGQKLNSYPLSPAVSLLVSGQTLDRLGAASLPFNDFNLVGDAL